ncbi:MAG: hypothetical protein FWG05_06515, partial [Kiritimatiellaeota bacterium]|nr:hypothetical protein [Kiritimatiellota bacterium]
PRLDKHITDSFYFALVVQTLLGMFSGMIFDGGVLGACFLCAFAGYWGFALIVCFRRPKSPTKWDIRFLRYGSLLLPLLTPMLYRLYWKLGYYGYL